MMITHNLLNSVDPVAVLHLVLMCSIVTSSRDNYLI